jgi:hypothetical protein
MATIKDLLINVFDNLESNKSISKTRLTKLVYLCDWKHAIEYGEQITKISWVFDNYGPFVWDVMNSVENNPQIFNVKEVKNSKFGSESTLISLNQDAHDPARLDSNEKRIVEFVVKSTVDLIWGDFIKLVYSTYPVVASTRHEKLNLVEIANEYKNTPFFINVSPEVEYLRIDNEIDTAIEFDTF